MGDGKMALVTGASEGLGRAFVLRLAEEGYAVTAVARSEAKLKDLLSSIRKGSHQYLAVDLTTESGIAKVCSLLEEDHYHLLINNAGMGVYGQFKTEESHVLESIIDLNCRATSMLSHSFCKLATSGDALMNVSGVLGALPVPGMSIYAATKAFVTSLSKSLWFEMKSQNVFVLGLIPGPIETRFQKNAGGEDHLGPPKAIRQTPEKVVDSAISALRARKKPYTVVAKLRVKIIFTLLNLAPEHLAMKIMSRFH